MAQLTAKSYIQNLETAVAALAGKRGVVEARARLERVKAAHAAHRANLNGNPLSPRSIYQIERGQRDYRARCKDAVEGYPRQALGLPIHADVARRSTHRNFVDSYAIGAISELHPGSCIIARVGDWWLQPVEEQSKDWNHYSKSWHRQHGAKVTVDRRYVKIRRVVNGRVESRDVDVNGWRGHWALNALLSAGVVLRQSVPKHLRPVQLHPAFSVSLHRDIAGIQIYARSLGGYCNVYDYCAVYHGLTFHASSPRMAVAGLREKLHATIEQRERMIDWRLCKKLGFCDEGILSFCRDFSLDPNGRYSAEQVLDHIRGDLPALPREQVEPYARELKTLAEAVDFDYSDLV